jgi:hypothetical protein
VLLGLLRHAGLPPLLLRASSGIIGLVAQARDRLNPEDNISGTEPKKRTLTNLYDARTTWLTNAHAALDRAVFAAYGWPGELGVISSARYVSGVVLAASLFPSARHAA